MKIPGGVVAAEKNLKIEEVETPGDSIIVLILDTLLEASSTVHIHSLHAALLSVFAHSPQQPLATRLCMLIACIQWRRKGGGGLGTPNIGNKGAQPLQS